jgi:hypothetical protein
MGHSASKSNQPFDGPQFFLQIGTRHEFLQSLRVSSHARRGLQREQDDIGDFHGELNDNYRRAAFYPGVNLNQPRIFAFYANTYS